MTPAAAARRAQLTLKAIASEFRALVEPYEGTRHSERYWRALLEPWDHVFLNQAPFAFAQIETWAQELGQTWLVNGAREVRRALAQDTTVATTSIHELQNRLVAEFSKVPTEAHALANVSLSEWLLTMADFSESFATELFGDPCPAVEVPNVVWARALGEDCSGFERGSDELLEMAVDAVGVADAVDPERVRRFVEEDFEAVRLQPALLWLRWSLRERASRLPEIQRRVRARRERDEALFASMGIGAFIDVA